MAVIARRAGDGGGRGGEGLDRTRTSCSVMHVIRKTTDCRTRDTQTIQPSTTHDVSHLHASMKYK